MIRTNPLKPTPIEVWLSQKNLQVTCRIVHDDESTEELDIDSLSMRGAQREITGYLLKQNYTPVGRWSVTHDNEDGEGMETVRHFRPKEMSDVIGASALSQNPNNRDGINVSPADR